MTFAQPFAGYEILEKVGSGAMGTVFKARQKHMNRIVALKVLKPSLARNRRYVERLEREARIVGALNHPNIVTGYDLGDEGGYHFFVMEFVEGDSLRRLLSEWGIFPEEQVLDVAIQIAEALDHAFQRGVIHRDIKPGNILIDAKGRVKLTDMGLAKGPTDVTLTRDGATVGTPQYISPEQARDPQAADIRSDLYSLGATLYHMATGGAPFQGDTIGELITKVLSERAPSAAGANPQLSDGLSLVIRKLLAKDPDLRYQTPRELLDDLRRVQRDERPHVDLGRIERSERSGEPRRWWVVAAAGIAVVVAVVWALIPPAEPPVLVGESAAAFRDRLRDQVARAGDDYPRRFRLIDQLRRGADSDAKRRDADEFYEDQVANLDERVGQTLGGFSAGRRQEMVDWLQTELDCWREGDLFLERVVLPELRERTGYDLKDLPVEVRQSARERLERLRREIDAITGARDAALETRYESHLSELDGTDSTVRADLAADDFEAARSALDAHLAGFFGEGGRPALDQLGDSLRSSLERRREEVRAAWRSAIDEAEQRVAADLIERVARQLEQLRGQLAEPGRAAHIGAALTDMRQRLEEHYPPPSSFAAAADPWRRVDKDVAELEVQVGLRVAVEERARLRGSTLKLAYSIAVRDGDLDRALKVAEDRSLRDPDNSAILDRHRELLRAAARVERDLLAAVAERTRGKAFNIRTRSGQGRVLTRDGDGGPRLQRVLPSGDRESIPLVAVDLDEIVSRAGADWLDAATAAPDGRAGLAMWRLFAGQLGSALELVTDRPELAAAIEDDAIPILDGITREVSSTEGEAERAISDALLAVGRADLPVARHFLAMLDGPPLGETQAAADSAARIAEARDWVRREAARRELESALRDAFPPAAHIDVTLAGGVEVAYGPPALAALERVATWRSNADGLRFDAGGPDLEQALAQALRVPTSLATGADAAAVFRLRCPPRASPALTLMEVHGVALALVVLADGRCGVEVLAQDSMARAAPLERALEGLVDRLSGTPAAFVVPGAYHDIGVELAASGKRVEIRCTFDGRVIWRGNRPRSGKEVAELRLAPLQPLDLGAITTRGSADR